MPDTRTDEIRARDAAATPGPWGTSRDLNGTYTIKHGTYVTAEDGFGSDGDVAVLVGDEETAYANGSFIARAREDVPYLLGRMAVLEAALDRVEGLATRLEEFAENALRVDDRELYTAIASDIRTRIARSVAGVQQHAATLDTQVQDETGGRLVCPFCKALQRVNRDGRMRRHGDADRPCPGSGTTAAPEELQS